MQSLPSTTTACAASLLQTVPELLWYIRRHMRRHRSGLSVPQFRVLLQIQSNPHISLSAVAEHLGASLPTASRMVANLVNKNFLSRAETPADRRQVALALTPSGKSIVDAARRASITQMERELRPLSPKDRDTVCHAMAILAGFVRSARAPEIPATQQLPPTDRKVPRPRPAADLHPT